MPASQSVSRSVVQWVVFGGGGGGWCQSVSQSFSQPPSRSSPSYFLRCPYQIVFPMQENASLPHSTEHSLSTPLKLSRTLNYYATIHTSVEIYCCDNNVTSSTCIDMFAPSSKSSLVVSAVFIFGFLLSPGRSLPPCWLLLFLGLESCTADSISSECAWYLQSCSQVGFYIRLW